MVNLWSFKDLIVKVPVYILWLALDIHFSLMLNIIHVVTTFKIANYQRSTKKATKKQTVTEISKGTESKLEFYEARGSSTWGLVDRYFTTSQIKPNNGAFRSLRQTNSAMGQAIRDTLSWMIITIPNYFCEMVDRRVSVRENPA